MKGTRFLCQNSKSIFTRLPEQTTLIPQKVLLCHTFTTSINDHLQLATQTSQEIVSSVSTFLVAIISYKVYVQKELDEYMSRIVTISVSKPLHTKQ